MSSDHKQGTNSNLLEIIEGIARGDELTFDECDRLVWRSSLDSKPSREELRDEG